MNDPTSSITRSRATASSMALRWSRIGVSARTCRRAVIIRSRVPDSSSNCCTTSSAVARVDGSSRTIVLYSASTVVICWPAWILPSSPTALCPSPAAPIPSAVCSRAVKSRSVPKHVRPVAATASRANRLPAGPSSSRRS
ncbi:hypothetical protein LUW74_29930 [Actinomadura madurae]|uniref:hypothetical protein n=1 Tax=Actinomadura madurae TaxID=1993 RepID=UPI002025FAAC|nr:hypothetical protein [Actinomadura madurae]URN07131.1 hypothetical protein LUW74_29930 [Actinomadura madurae]